MTSHIPSPEMLDALKQAAELRAAGIAWEAVASQLGRTTATCRSWPSRYREHWQKLYAAAEKWLACEAGAEARVFLRKLLRSGNERVVLGSGRALLANRPKPRPRPKKIDDVSREDAAMVAVWRSLTDEDADRIAQQYLERRRRALGPACGSGPP